MPHRPGKPPATDPAWQAVVDDLPMIRRAARRLRSPLDYDDVVQALTIGYYEAARTWRPDGGRNFRSWAFVKMRYAHVNACREMLGDKNYRIMKRAGLLWRFEWSLDAAFGAHDYGDGDSMVAAGNKNLTLNHMVASRDVDTADAAIAAIDDAKWSAVWNWAINEARARCTARTDFAVLDLLAGYCDERTLTEIAEEYGVHLSTVSLRMTRMRGIVADLLARHVPEIEERGAPTGSLGRAPRPKGPSRKERAA